MSTGRNLNAAFNLLEGVMAYKRDRQQHANDLAQQAVNNAEAAQRTQLALQALGTANAMARRKITFDFLEQQKAALQAQGSASVQAAWAGIEGGTAHDIMVSVQQELAQTEIARDEGLRAIHQEAIARSADIVAQGANARDQRNFSKPEILANVLGIGKNILDDFRASGTIG